MLEVKVKILNNAGLHTRPAATIVKLAARYKADFFISKDGFLVNGKSIIGVMTLAAEKGCELTLTFNGEDELEASREIVDFFNRGFDEV